MASSSRGPSALSGEQLDIFKERLYKECQEAGSSDDLFTQQDLLDLDVIPGRNAAQLLEVVQALSNDRLLVGVADRNGLAWKWRDRKEAEKYKLCGSDEQALVYSMIDDSGPDGIWSQRILKRLNMHESVFKAAIKQLQAKNLVAQFTNVEHPSKKMFIKASIRPSERATGGPWYTDQNLDEAFIEELQRVIFDTIKIKSTYKSTHSTGRMIEPKKGVLKGGLGKGKKRAADEMSRENGTVGRAPAQRKEVLLPLQAGYTQYPTVRDIARILSNSGITNNTTLGEDDVQKLVDVLVYDGLVEQIQVGTRAGYRVTRVPKQSAESWAGRRGETQRLDLEVERGMPEPPANGYTEAPCGRCPVFELCEEGGPIGPSNCEYFPRWLNID